MRPQALSTSPPAPSSASGAPPAPGSSARSRNRSEAVRPTSISRAQRASWLVGHGLDYDTDLNQDLNGDGVSILMAYALDLDPHQNLRASLPQPELDRESLSLSFHAASRGVTYTVETSTDLQHWTREGVSFGGSGDPNLSRASVEVGAGGARYLRLVVGEVPAGR